MAKVRTVGHRLIWMLIVPIAAVGLVGCTTGARAVASGAGVSPAALETPSNSASLPPGTLSGTDDGLTLTVMLDRTAVAPGGTVTARVVIHNGRTVPVDYPPIRCETPVLMQVSLPLPLESVGRVWDGVAGTFKRQMLTDPTLGPAGTPNTGPLISEAPRGPCGTSGSGELLGPGQTSESSLTWSAELVPGVPALPGTVPFTVTFEHDIQNARPSPPPETTRGATAAWMARYKTLAVSGELTITGPVRRLVTAGQAIDAVLGDARFVAFLARHPAASWQYTNLALFSNDPVPDITIGPGSGGTFHSEPGNLVPRGTSWEVGLVIGEPRAWAYGYVNPFTGLLLQVTVCEAPCSR